MAFPRAEARGFYRRAAGAARQARFVFCQLWGRIAGNPEVSGDRPPGSGPERRNVRNTGNRDVSGGNGPGRKARPRAPSVAAHSNPWLLPVASLARSRELLLTPSLIQRGFQPPFRPPRRNVVSPGPRLPALTPWRLLASEETPPGFRGISPVLLWLFGTRSTPSRHGASLRAGSAAVS